MNRTIRILIVDDHALVRESLAGLLRLQPDFEVIGTVADAQSIDKWFDHDPPDVVSMDIDTESRRFETKFNAKYRLRAGDDVK